ncbi:hypothetical protein, partial [Photobacterium carnosum]|uniref:hypothetical protein n=1 Tax=Photobacterium carnosum TaxID=2023717 RepID=UPI00242FF5EC
ERGCLGPHAIAAFDLINLSVIIFTLVLFISTSSKVDENWEKGKIIILLPRFDGCYCICFLNNDNYLKVQITFTYV